MAGLFKDEADNTQLEGVIAELRSLAQKLSDASSKDSDQKRKRLLKRIDETESRLRDLRFAIDPVSQPPFVLDPSNPEVIGRIIAETLLRQQLCEFDSVSAFYGSGVYAIYYRGDHEAYAAISRVDVPIYVGKADPQSSDAATPEQQGQKLYDRLFKEHRKSIAAAENLSLDDFKVRYLVVRSAWQKTAEQYLIDSFKPVWNKEFKVCEGFGKHGDSSSTRANKRSRWDTIHPGRTWAWSDGNIDNDKTPEAITKEIKSHYERWSDRLGLA